MVRQAILNMLKKWRLMVQRQNRKNYTGILKNPTISRCKISSLGLKVHIFTGKRVTICVLIGWPSVIISLKYRNYDSEG